MNRHNIHARTLTKFSDSRVCLDSLQNSNNLARLVEEIEKKMIKMVRDKFFIVKIFEFTI